MSYSKELSKNKENKLSDSIKLFKNKENKLSDSIKLFKNLIEIKDDINILGIFKYKNQDILDIIKLIEGNESYYKKLIDKLNINVKLDELIIKLKFISKINFNLELYNTIPEKINEEKINTILYNNNYYDTNNNKPNYIKGICSGYDLLYLDKINNKLQKINELFILNNNHIDILLINYFFNIIDIDEIDENINNYIKENIKENIKDKKRKKSSKNTSSISTSLIRNKKKQKKEGGSDYILNSIIKKYLLNQYIYDCNHDFKGKLINNLSEILYNESDLNPNNDKLLESLYTLSDKKIFHTILEYNPIYIEKIFYFSIHNLININPNTDIKGVPIIKNNTDIDNIKKNIIEFYSDVLNTKNFKFLLDVKMNLGVLTDEAIQKYAEKIVEKKIITNTLELVNKRLEYENIKKNFFEYVMKNRIYTLEDSYDSAPVSHKDIINYINQSNIEQNINLFCYISHLIFSDEDLSNIKINNDYKSIFKAFNEDTRKLFNVVYYRQLNHPYNIRTALVFKEEKYLETPINSDIIKIVRNTNYLYQEILNTTITTTFFYAIDLENIKNFNSISRIITNITKFIYKNNTINNLEYIILLYIIKYHFDKHYNYQKTFKLSQVNNEIKKQSSRTLLDLKKAGDSAKILFVFFYNYLNNNTNINIDVDIKNSYNSIKQTIPDKLLFSGNDKLTVLNSMLRDKHSIIFSDTANYSFCIYNNYPDFTFKNLLNNINIFLNPNFISEDFCVFNIINDNTNIDINIKYINNIFLNIPHELIYFFKNKNDNINNIINDCKEYLKTELKNLNNTINITNSEFQDEIDFFLINNNCILKYDNYKNKKTLENIYNDIIKIDPNIDFLNYKKILNQTIENKFNQIICLYYQLNQLNQLDQLLNNYIKIILENYLQHIFININKKVNNKNNIDFFIKSILFTNIDYDGSNNESKNLIETITLKIFENIINIFNSIILNITYIIKNNNTHKLSDISTINTILGSISHIIKIFELFLIYNENSNIKSITKYIDNINNYFYEILYMKNEGINILYNDPSIIVINTIGSVYNQKTLNIPKKIKQDSLNIANNLLVSSKYINFIFLFNDFYNYFNKINNIKILDKEIIKTTEFITSIKKIYNYSFINLKTDEFKNNIEILFSSMKKRLEEIKNIAIMTLDNEQISHFESVIINVLSSIDKSYNYIITFIDNTYDDKLSKDMVFNDNFKYYAIINKSITTNIIVRNTRTKKNVIPPQNLPNIIYYNLDNDKIKLDISLLNINIFKDINALKKIDKKLLLIPIKNSHLDKLIKAYEYLIDPKEIRIQSLSIPKKKSLSLSKEPKQQSLPLSKQLKQKSLSLLKEKEQPIATNSSIFAMILEVPKYINETYKNLAKDWYNILFTQTVS